MLEETLLLTRRDVAKLLKIDAYIEAIEHVFRLHGENKTENPGILGVHCRNGGFHIKAGLLELERSYFAAKVNANFPQNAKCFGLPLIQGVIVLADAENGHPLAVMDSIEITIQRTGAATAAAAKYLARPKSHSLTICGCGNQGRISARALTKIFPLERLFAYDVDEEQARRFATDVAEETGLTVEIVEELGVATSISDIVVTCTPAQQFFLKREHVRGGTFVAAVGADSESKQELDPTLLSKNKVVVDMLSQAATIGEVHHALDSGLMKKEEVYAELGEVIAQTKPGRSSAEEIIIFDSTGMALQDVVAAASVYEKAVSEGAGRRIDFSH